MSHWKTIRAQARALHQQAAGADVADLRPAAEIVERVAQQAGVMLCPVPEGDPLLCGALAVLEFGCVFYNADVHPGFALYCQAHELAHHFLHQGQTHCGINDLQEFITEDTDPRGEAKVANGYGPHEQREREANIFARELLLPADKLRRCFIEQNMTARAIAGLSGTPQMIVQHQLAHALLVAEAVAAPAPASRAAKPLDESQHTAVTVAAGPLLVEAGPGTGKTTTLVRRVWHLLETGYAPENILCLTFSNKAANEMRERVAQGAPAAAGRVWMGTFHAFGLELLRRYWREAGLPPKPALLDPIDAIFLLERALPELELDYYQSLAQPTRYLGNILGAISRAKDELAGPERYRRLAQQMSEQAATGDAREQAAKALEVARVYEFYERLLQHNGWLDFGDLLFRSVRLLQDRTETLTALRQRFHAVLVDEYQDVNRAGSVLLQLLAGDGAGLWAVGDARQSIFRWRGASPANMRLFAEDFPGGQVWPLSVNYRSQPPVLETFSALAPQMKAARNDAEFTPWTPRRAHEGGSVSYEVAATWEDEARHLASEIRRHRAAGRAFRDQAVICRTHSQLNRVAAALEQENIPLLYLGDLFTRAEVRDLLALLRLSCENGGRCLVRAARFPEYQLPLTAVRRLLRAARERGLTFPQALGLAQEIDEFDAAVKKRFALLARHLDGLERESAPWPFLAEYLFNRSGYLRPLLRDESAAGRQKRLALYQFLQFALAQRGADVFAGVAPRHALGRYVRRLEAHHAGRDYAPLPDWADEIDAVRLLTIHAAKGLEFPVVYLPHLGQRYFPGPRQAEFCPPPTGLAEGFTDAKSEHEEEEQCLFFVALSRARDHLALSCARSYNQAKSHPSAFLALIAGSLPRPAGVAPVPPVTADARNSPPKPAETDALPRFAVHQLDKYLSCPRRYYYEEVLKLSGQREETAYSRFLDCVYDTLRCLHQTTDENAALAHLAAVWPEKGPLAHPYEQLYYRQAQRLVRQAASFRAAQSGVVSHPVWEIKLSNGSVYVRPEALEATPGGARLAAHRFRTGRAPKNTPDDALYGLYFHAMQTAYPRAEHLVRIFYLTSGATQELKMSPRQTQGRLAKYETAITRIQHEEFPARPQNTVCPACPHYFICPSGAGEQAA